MRSKRIIQLINDNKGEISIENVNQFIYEKLIPKKLAFNEIKIGDWTAIATSENLVRECDFGFGALAKISSQRLQVFKKSNKCICCEIKGTHYEKTFEGGNNSFHLNLYSKQPDGSKILMTKDHLTPVSKGGTNTLDNYVTCCTECNMFKGNSDYTWDELKDLLSTKTSCELKSLLKSSVNTEHIERIKKRMEMCVNV